MPATQTTVHFAQRLAMLLAAAIPLVGCGDAVVPPTPPVSPGSSAAPREINIVARDYAFSPPVVDLVPGETVIFHFVNGGLETHEAVIGGQDVQEAWEEAQAAAAGHPPGPTPVVSVPANVAGLRLVAGSGQRADARWTIPADAAGGGAWYVGCHIPGHFAHGMQVPVRFLGPDGMPLGTRAASPTARP